MKYIIVSCVASSILLVSCAKQSSGSQQNPADSISVTHPVTDSVLNPDAWIVSTIAGNGTQSDKDGPAQGSELNQPLFMSMDGSGTLYFDEGAGSTIRRLNSDGTVSTYADLADIYSVTDPPKGMTFDADGKLYIIVGHKIYNVTASGPVALAGSSSDVYQDGTGSSAGLHYVRSLTFDPVGRLLITDFDQFDTPRLRSVTFDGVVNTLNLVPDEGLPVNIGGQANETHPVVLDRSGNIFFSDGMDLMIKKVNPEGKVSLFVGSPQWGWKDGIGAEAQFSQITAMAFDPDGNLWVVDKDNHVIRRITPAGKVETIAGKPGTRDFADGEAHQAMFNYPIGLAINKKGEVFVSDYVNCRIRKISRKG